MGNSGSSNATSKNINKNKLSTNKLVKTAQETISNPAKVQDLTTLKRKLDTESANMLTKLQNAQNKAKSAKDHYRSMLSITKQVEQKLASQMIARNKVNNNNTNRNSI